jgi:hypothetical protein
MSDKQWINLLFNILLRIAPDNAEIRALKEMYYGR